jgi:hypothetical protein
VQYKCVLYFNVPSNKRNINFVDNKETVRKELDDLSFNGLICELEPRQYDNERARLPIAHRYNSHWSIGSTR